jgi:hypothetical protein
MASLDLITIFGRYVALIPDETMEKEQDAHAQFINCDGEDFDVIFYNPHDKNLKQTILHELFHGVFFRTAIYQGEISDDMIEIICDNMATFLVETFDLKLKKR